MLKNNKLEKENKSTEKQQTASRYEKNSINVPFLFSVLLPVEKYLS